MNPTDPLSLVFAEHDPSATTVPTVMGSPEMFEERHLKATILTDPVSLFAMAARWFARVGEGTLITPRVPLYVFDDGDTERQIDELIAKVRPEGWIAGEGWRASKSGWVSFTHPSHPSIHLGIRALITDPMIEGPTHEVAVRLSRYQKLTGAAYRATPGVSGTAGLRNWYDTEITVFPRGQRPTTRKRYQPKWTWNVTDTMLRGRGDIVWQRNPLPFETKMPWALAFDVRAMYLAAAAGVRLGWDKPEHRHGLDATYDVTEAGFYRIDARALKNPEQRKGMVPLLNANRIASDGSCWVSHPILDYIVETKLPMPTILESWVSPKASTYLRGWAEVLRDALPDAQTAGDPILRKMIKRTYTEGVGMMGRAGGRVYRRDWQAAIQDEAAVRLLRKVDKVTAGTGIVPLQVKTDCVWYPSPDGDPLTFLTALGTDPDAAPRIGQFAVDRKNSGTMAAYLEANRPKRGTRK